MDIQSASVNMSQSHLQEEFSARLQAMSLDSMKTQSVELQRLLESGKLTISDPNLGRNIDFSA